MQGEDEGDTALRTSTLGPGKEKQPSMEAKDSQREEGEARETSIPTDRQMARGLSRASGAKLKSQLCHLPAGRPWESLSESPCLCFPILTMGSQLQAHSFITLWLEL